MPEQFYIADWHYGHTNALAFDNRPFKTVEEMNVSLVDRWNSVVQASDIVYVLGDMFWCKTTEAIPVLESLHGVKILVKGNHDKVKDFAFRREFAAIEGYMEIEDGDKRIVLCHYPIPCYKNHFYGWYHFYGHVHSSFEHNMMEHDKYLLQELYQKPCEMYNVGVMMPYIDYTPRTFEEIVSRASA